MVSELHPLDKYFVRQNDTYDLILHLKNVISNSPHSNPSFRLMMDPNFSLHLFIYFIAQQMKKKWKYHIVFMILQSGCIAGNLMIKNHHNEFPSDIFTTLEAAGANVEVFGKNFQQ